MNYHDNGVLELISKDNKQVTIRICDDPNSRQFVKGKEHSLSGITKLRPGRVKKHYAVHLGEITEPHRVIMFDWLGR